MTCSDYTVSNGEISLTATENDYVNNVFRPGVFVVTITGTAVESNGSQSQDATIEFTLKDPCDPPVSVTKAALTDQTYTLTTTDSTYTHPVFTVVPAFCPLTYSYSETSLTDGDGNSDTAISRVDKTFSFFYDKDNAPVNPVAQKQTVTITATSGSKYPTVFPSQTDNESFDLTFIDPCLSDTTS